MHNSEFAISCSMKRKTYSVVDMVVLSILLKTPMNAYSLARYVEQNNVTHLVRLSTPAIYKSCKRLFEQGYLSGVKMREGEAPVKVMYSVTVEGNTRFYELMGHFAGTFEPFYFDFNSVVYGLERMGFEQGLKLIDSYEVKIKAADAWLAEHVTEAGVTEAFASRMIVKQYQMMVRVLGEWLVQLRQGFIKERQ